MLNVRHNLRGFTLTELMVAMVIAGFLTAAGVPSFMTWIQNRQLSAAAGSLSAGLQLARAEAVRRNTAVQFTLTGTNNVPSDWTVGCVTPVGDLDLDGKPDCPATIEKGTGTEGTPNAVVNADVANVAFNGLGRLPPGNNMTINVTNTKGGACAPAGPMRCLNITVASGGEIRMCDPTRLRINDPRGC